MPNCLSPYPAAIHGEGPVGVGLNVHPHTSSSIPSFTYLPSHLACEQPHNVQTQMFAHAPDLNRVRQTRGPKLPKSNKPSTHY